MRTFIPDSRWQSITCSPFDPTAPELSRKKPLLVGWNEDEYTFFAWEQKDTEFATLDFEGVQKRLEPQ